jgi:hypothetical protein
MLDALADRDSSSSSLKIPYWFRKPALSVLGDLADCPEQQRFAD